VGGERGRRGSVDRLPPAPLSRLDGVVKEDEDERVRVASPSDDMVVYPQLPEKLAGSQSSIQHPPGLTTT